MGRPHDREVCNNFINELIKTTEDDFRCIDIGYLSETNEWVVVEINPPFSLDDYKINLTDYMNFCIGACKWLNKKLTKLSN